MTSRCHHRLSTVPYFSVRLSRTSAIGGHLDQVPTCPMKGNPRQSWTLGSTLYIPDSRYWIPVLVCGTWFPDFDFQWDSGFLELYSRLQSTGFRTPQAKFFSDSGFDKQKFRGIGFPYMVRNSSLKMTISHLLRGPGTVCEESLNPDARLLGKVETNYRMAASNGERSTPTILRKNRGT